MPNSHSDDHFHNTRAIMLPEEAIPRDAPIRKYRNVSRTSLLVRDAGIGKKKRNWRAA